MFLIQLKGKKPKWIMMGQYKMQKNVYIKKKNHAPNSYEMRDASRAKQKSYRKV